MRSCQEGKAPTMLDRWWVRLLAAVWIVVVIVVYFRTQILRIVEMSSAAP